MLPTLPTANGKWISWQDFFFPLSLTFFSVCYTFFCHLIYAYDRFFHWHVSQCLAVCYFFVHLFTWWNLPCLIWVQVKYLTTLWWASPVWNEIAFAYFSFCFIFCFFFFSFCCCCCYFLLFSLLYSLLHVPLYVRSHFLFSHVVVSRSLQSQRFTFGETKLTMTKKLCVTIRFNLVLMVWVVYANGTWVRIKLELEGGHTG